MTAHVSLYKSTGVQTDNWRTSVVYTAVDIKGMFVDAVDRGDPPNSEILRFKWDDVEQPIFAVIRSKNDGAIGIYAMSIATGRPVLIEVVRPSDPAGPATQSGTRHWPSRESKEWRARRRWEER